MDKVLDSAIPSSANKRKGTPAIGVYPDDIELGCSVSLARLARRGVYIATVVMTTGNPGVDGIIDRHEESHDALKMLGCHQTIHFNFADICAYLQFNDMIPVLEDTIKNQTPSDVEVICAYAMRDADRHQDHLVAYQASMAAYRAIPQILGCEIPSAWLSFMPQVFGSVKEEYFSLELAALKKYKNRSQQDCMRPGRLRAIAQFRG